MCNCRPCVHLLVTSDFVLYVAAGSVLEKPLPLLGSEKCKSNFIGAASQENLSSGFSTRSYIHWPDQPKKQASVKLRL